MSTGQVFSNGNESKYDSDWWTEIRTKSSHWIQSKTTNSINCNSFSRHFLFIFFFLLLLLDQSIISFENFFIIIQWSNLLNQYFPCLSSNMYFLTIQWTIQWKIILKNSDEFRLAHAYFLYWLFQINSTISSFAHGDENLLIEKQFHSSLSIEQRTRHPCDWHDRRCQYYRFATDLSRRSIRRIMHMCAKHFPVCLRSDLSENLVRYFDILQWFISAMRSSWTIDWHEEYLHGTEFLRRNLLAIFMWSLFEWKRTCSDVQFVYSTFTSITKSSWKISGFSSTKSEQGNRSSRIDYPIHVVLREKDSLMKEFFCSNLIMKKIEKMIDIDRLLIQWSSHLIGSRGWWWSIDFITEDHCPRKCVGRLLKKCTEFLIGLFVDENKKQMRTITIESFHRLKDISHASQRGNIEEKNGIEWIIVMFG